MERICLIPARGGSRRIPRKNIADFEGKPLLVHSLDTAAESGLFDRIIVSTEDRGIADVAHAWAVSNPGGATLVLHQRPFSYARDEVGTQVVAAQCLNELRIDARSRVCLLYATAPLLDSLDLVRSADLGARYVVAVGTDPLRDAGAFYWGRCGDFRELVPLYSASTRIYPLPEDQVCDINTPDDLERARVLYRKARAVESGSLDNDVDDTVPAPPAGVIAAHDGGGI